MLVRELMTKDVITISPEAPLKEAGRILKEKRISGIPVVDEDGNLVGIVTISDILRILQEIYKWHELEKKATGLNISDMENKERLNTKVKNVMTKSVYTIEEDKNINDVMGLMFTKNIHTIPVVKNNKLAGVIGKRDLIHASF